MVQHLLSWCYVQYYLMLEQTAEHWFPWRMPPAIWQAALHTRDGLERSIKVGEHTETLI